MAERTRWEYFILEGKTILDKDRERFEGELNMLGDQGWEVASTTEQRLGRPAVIMKRVRVDD
jgi:hypothetical protein